MDRFNGNSNTAPKRACIFQKMGEVQFDNTGGSEKKRFKITGYSGKVIPNHWFWGNVAFDLSGIKFAKKKTPVLEEHFTERRIGFADKQEITDKVTFEGPFLSSAIAEQIRSDIQEGFPMEASLSIPPSVIEYVGQGASVEVNGHTLKGPGAVFRQAIIDEVSMCVLGADSNTESKAFSGGVDKNIEFNLADSSENNFERDHIMAEKQTEKGFTPDTFKSQYPDVHKQVFDAGKAEGVGEGEKKEREYFKSLAGVIDGDNDLLVECYRNGKTEIEAVKMANEKLKKANAELAEKATKQSDQDSEAGSTATGEKATPARQEFSDQQKPKAKAETSGGRMTDEQLNEEFNNSAELQDEFNGNVKSYIAFKKKEAEGRVKLRK